MYMQIKTQPESNTKLLEIKEINLGTLQFNKILKLLIALHLLLLSIEIAQIFIKVLLKVAH